MFYGSTQGNFLCFFTSPLQPGLWGGNQGPGAEAKPWRLKQGPMGWSQGLRAGGFGEVEKRSNGENYPVWSHRTSAPPGLMPHLLYSKQQ